MFIIRKNGWLNMQSRYCMDEDPNPGGGKGAKTFTQEELDKIVSERVNKEVNKRKGLASKVVSDFRSEHGLDDDALNEFKSWQEQKNAGQDPETRFKKREAALIKERDDAVKERDKAVSRFNNERIGNEIASAISSHERPVIPEAVNDLKMTFRSMVEVGEDGNLVPRDPDGNVVTGKSVSDYIHEQLNKRPWALSSDIPGGGAGSKSGKNGKSDEGKPPTTPAEIGNAYASIVNEQRGAVKRE